MRAILALLCLGGMTVSACMPSPLEAAGPTRVSFWRSHIDTLSAPVGKILRLGMGARPDKAPTVTPSDPSAVNVLVNGQDWNLYEAQLTLLKPGAVHLVAELQGTRAEALVASLDPQVGSKPLGLLVGIPAQVAGRAPESRLIVDADGWKSFVSTFYPAGSVPDLAPPVDLTQQSLIALIADANDDSGTPVMTHLVAGPPATATIVLPQLANRTGSTGQKSGVVTLLEVPRLSPETQIDVKSLATVSAETISHE